MKLKTCSLPSAFILVNTLSDWNLPGSRLSQTGSRALPSQIPYQDALTDNKLGGGRLGWASGDGQGKSQFAPGRLLRLQTQLRAAWALEELLSCTSICLLLSGRTHSPGKDKDISPCSVSLLGFGVPAGAAEEPQALCSRAVTPSKGRFCVPSLFLAPGWSKSH